MEKKDEEIEMSSVQLAASTSASDQPPLVLKSMMADIWSSSRSADDQHGDEKKGIGQGDEEDLKKNDSIMVVDVECPLQDNDMSRNKKDENDEPQEDNESYWWLVLQEEFHAMRRLSVPIILTFLLEFLPNTVGIILVGQIDDNDDILEGAAMGTMIFLMTAVSMGFGLATAMDTLCSQASGAQEGLQMGLYLQTGMLVLSMNFLFVAIIHYYSEAVLLGLGQPASVAALAGQFTRRLIPGIPFLFVYELLKKVLQAQNIAQPSLLVSLLCNLVYALCGYFLVYHTSLGWLGAAVARTICNVCFGLFLVIYVIVSGSWKGFWPGIQLSKAVSGLYQFLELGIPGMFQMSFEWWAFESLGLLCGWLEEDSVVAIGVNAVVVNLSTLVFMFYLGISVAGSVRVGNALGENHILRAKLASYLTWGYCFCMGLIVAIVTVVFRNELPHLYTQDKEIVERTSRVLIVLAAFQVFDATQASVHGVLRASGRHLQGAVLNFASFYFVGIPLGALFAFQFDWNVLGIWTGLSLGLSLMAMIGVVIVLKSDWNYLALQAKKRLLDTV